MPSKAAELIRAGRLVAFPTETVYGLGAHALDPQAVERIYRAKGRPQTSPLIVHVASIEMARGLAAHWPDSAERLARKFWPGPLTLVVPKASQVPDIVTAGLPTVGLRQPNHPMALDLLREAGIPIAAPSANRFSELSPTTAEHVIESLGEAVDLVLDGGPTPVGIESTVLSLADVPAVLLRPGRITQEQIEEVIGPVRLGGAPEGAHPSPGMHARHYSPRTPLYLVAPSSGWGASLWLFQPEETACAIQMPADPDQYGAILYDTLHRLDAQGFDWIAVELPPDWPEWTAIRDRLVRASTVTSVT
ncbi:MAG: threonylcarbamoyl-AMP synthase [Acidobacteria bacterium]|nr:threonylcarbamoyl-AMP synthase [Acidobacteriota bacterium]